MRTTLNIDAPIFEEIRQLAGEQSKSIGRVASDLLAEALHTRRRGNTSRKPARFEWVSRPMRALTPLDDGGALYAQADTADRRSGQGPAAPARKTRAKR